MNETAVTAVILSYRSPSTLPSVIDHVDGQTVRAARVIVVDNGSHDDSVAYLAGRPAGVEPVLLERNEGVGAGHNRGWALALQDPATRFVWSLEHDSLPDPACLERLLETYAFLTERGLTVGCVYPVQVLPEHLADRRDVTPPPGSSPAPPLDAWNNGVPHLTSKLHLNGALFTRAAIEAAGYLRDDFVVGQEDREYALRLLDAGFAVVRDPFAVVGHRNKGIGRRQLPSVLRAYYGTRNSTYMIRHLHRERFGTARVLGRAAAGVVRTVLFEDRKRARVRARLRATADGIAGRLGFADYDFLDR